MRYTKRKGDESTIRKVWSDDKEIFYGVIGTVCDLLAVGILETVNKHANPDEYMYIPALGIMQRPAWGVTRDEAVSKIQQHKA